MRLTIILILFAVQTMSTGFGQPAYLDQGWDEQQREEFYFTAQGSHLIPYEWFLALEQADNEKLFRADANMRSYGILPSPPSRRNPAGLPVGFVRDGVDPVGSLIAGLSNSHKKAILQSTRFAIKKAYLGPEYDEKLYPKEQKAWFGLTCAACHTHELEYEGQTIRIDGGSTQADHESFLRDLGKSLEATHKDPEKLKRFAIAVGRGESSLKEFDDKVRQIADAVNRLVLRNKAKHPYGFARLDAFGAILNAVCDTALNEPANRRESNACFSAAPFQFGEGRVMKFRASPVARSLAKPDVNQPDYLRNALIKRLSTETVVFEFGVQVRTADQLDLAKDIENAQTVWSDEFVTVATITIPPQKFDTPEQRKKCERLFFTPWHGIKAHTPLGGINRLRKAVYLASSNLRNSSIEAAKKK